MIAVHPGEYILEVYLEPLEITRAELADRLGVSTSSVSRLLAEKADVSPEMALRLERVLGRSAESWLAMQSSYNLVHVHEGLELEALRPIA